MISFRFRRVAFFAILAKKLPDLTDTKMAPENGCEGRKRFLKITKKTVGSCKNAEIITCDHPCSFSFKNRHLCSIILQCLLRFSIFGVGWGAPFRGGGVPARLV